MKNTVIKLSEMLVPYVKSLHSSAASIKFHGGDLPKTYQNRSALNIAKEKIAKMSDAKIIELITAAKEEIKTCQYPLNKESFEVVIKLCNFEIHDRKVAEAHAMVK